MSELGKLLQASSPTVARVANRASPEGSIGRTSNISSQARDGSETPPQFGVLYCDQNNAQTDTTLRGVEREQRRERVLEILASAPDSVRYVCVADEESHCDFVIVMMAIRGIGTAEISIEREKYDPFKLLEIIDHTGRS